jgi:6-phosphogluconolactonase (cycloisomerase 2 family)
VTIYIGSYPSVVGGDGGISVWGADLRPAAPTIALPSPSYLAVHPVAPVLYAVDEVTDGGVTALAVAADGSLTVVGRRSTGGSDPCHLAVTPDGRHLLGANYGSGSVCVFRLNPGGTLDDRTDLVDHHGSGPDPSRQGSPHAHHVSVRSDRTAGDGDRDGDGDSTVSVVDLGTDTLYGYRLSAGGRLTPAWRTAAGAGRGPRHLVATPGGRRYVTDELSSTVSVYDPSPAGLRLIHRRPATLTAPAGVNYPSGLALSPDNRFLYVANRGNNTIVTFAVVEGGGERGDGDHGDGELVGVDEISAGGRWPRQFTLDGDLMYVANQHSDRVSVLRVDPASGVPRPTGDRIEVPAPACVLSHH